MATHRLLINRTCHGRCLVTAYLATVNRLRDYAILKALGATQKQLYSILIQQTAYVIGLGAVFGWLMGFGAYLGLAMH